MLHPELPELVSCVRNFGFKIKTLEISTNAQHHDFDKLAKVFETGQLNLLVVSCDGDGTPEDYERLRPPAKWDKLLIFLEKAKTLRDNYAQNVTLMTRTICASTDGQKRWRDLLAPLGWNPQFRDWLNLPESADKRAKSENKGNRGLCPYMSSDEFLYVDFDGTVVPCCAHPRAFVLGNLKNEFFSSIVSSEKRRNLLIMLKKGRESLKICRKCDL